jgi:FkbM family methyltransferase
MIMSAVWLQSLKFIAHRHLLGSNTVEAKVPEFGLDLKVKVRDVIGRHIYKYGAHDLVMTRFLKDLLVLQPEDVVLDIGANIGWYSLILNSMAPNGVDIFAFEPHPENLALLRENVSRNSASSVTVVPCAVSDHPGEQDLFVYGGANAGRHSLLPINEGGKIRITTVTLDEFWAEQKLGDRIPRFIKIDIEGYELVALRGAPEVLSRCPTVLFEFSPQFMNKAGLAPAELLDLMYGMGFECTQVDEGRKAPVTREFLLSGDHQVNLLWQRAERT